MDDSLEGRRREAAGRSPDQCVTPYPDRPLILRGDFRITGADGAEIDPGRETVALCRSGCSALKPFCDGSHRRGFRASGGDERPRGGGRRSDQGLAALRELGVVGQDTDVTVRMR